MPLDYINAQPWRQQYQFNEETLSDITGWTTGTALPVGLRNSSVIVTKNRVYLLGGFTTTNVSTVYTAPINTDGTLGTWTTGTSIPVAIRGASVIVTKNRVYLLGGYTTAAVSTVYTAPINTDGTLGTWTTGTSLPGVLFTSTAVTTKDRVYLLGGNNGSKVTTVYTAPINTDGTLGTWTTGTSLPGVLSDSMPVVTKNRVYLLGGQSGTSAVSTVYTAPINSDGTLGTWTTGSSLPGVLGNSVAIVTSSRVYLLGGYTTVAVSTVYEASFTGGFNDYLDYSWYESLAVVLSLIEQIYSLKLTTSNIQRYGDVAVVSSLIDEYYSSSAVVKKRVDQIYEDAEVLRSFIDANYTLTTDLRSSILQPLKIASAVVRKSSEFVYNIFSNTFVYTSLPQVYSLFPESLSSNDVIVVTVTKPDNSSYVLNTGEVSVKYSQSSYVGLGSVDVVVYNDWVNVNTLDSITVTVNSQDYEFIVMSKTKSEDHNKLALQLEISSPAVLLSFPYAKEIQSNFTVSGTMSQIVNSLAALEGLSVVWEIPVDDVLTSDQLQTEGKAPIDCIREIVNELGGILQSHPDGSLHAFQRYKVDSDKYSTVSPAVTFSSGKDFLSLTEDTEKRDGYNKFSVTSSSLSSGWSLDTEQVNESTYKIKAFRVPWSSEAPTLTTSELTNVIITASLYPITEELEEEVEVVSGSGKVNKPCYAISSVDYKTSANLGAVTISEDGSLTTSTAGNSLVTVKYVTKYWLWTAYDPDKENVQFILEAA